MDFLFQSQDLDFVLKNTEYSLKKKICIKSVTLPLSFSHDPIDIFPENKISAFQSLV